MHFCPHTSCYLSPQVIETRMNSMFELATQDEIDKLRSGDSSSANKSSEELQLDDLEVQICIEHKITFLKVNNNDKNISLGYGQDYAYQGPDVLHQRMEPHVVPGLPHHERLKQLGLVWALHQ